MVRPLFRRPPSKDNALPTPFPLPGSLSFAKPSNAFPLFPTIPQSPSTNISRNKTLLRSPLVLPPFSLPGVLSSFPSPHERKRKPPFPFFCSGGVSSAVILRTCPPRFSRVIVLAPSGLLEGAFFLFPRFLPRAFLPPFFPPLISSLL